MHAMELSRQSLLFPCTSFEVIVQLAGTEGGMEPQQRAVSMNGCK